MKASDSEIIEAVVTGKLSESKRRKILEILRNEGKERADSSVGLLMTIPQVARELHVSRPTVYRMLRDGILQRVRIGQKCSRIRRADVEALVNRDNSKQ